MNGSQQIILIGAARSGTKFLRDLLAAHDKICAVPYDVNYIWRYGCDVSDDDVLDPKLLTDARRTFIRSQITRLSKAKAEETVLEKTVSNTLRVPFVDEVFPEARYIHLIRDGRDVVESAMRQWTTPPNWRALWKKLRNVPLANLGYVVWFGANFIRGRREGRGGGKVWGPRFPNSEKLVSEASLAKVCATQWMQSVTRASEDLAALSGNGDRVYTISYEELVRDDRALLDLVKWLNFSDPEKVLKTYHSKLKRPDERPWAQLSHDDQETILDVIDPLLTELGYLK